MVEKSRLYTVNKLEADQPVTTEAFVCEFSDLKVTGCYLDDFIKLSDGSNIDKKDLIVEYESSILK